MTDFQSANGGAGAFQFGNGGGFNSSGAVVAPPNTSNPVPSSQIANGSPLSFPPAAPADNGSSLVAGAVASANASNPQPPQQSPTPGLDSASQPSIGQTGDYTQDPSYQAANQNLNSAQNTFANGVNNSQGEAPMLANQQGAFGVGAKLQNLNDINTQLAKASADFNNASQTQETNGINSGTPSVYYQGAQAAIQRQKAVVVGGLAAQQQAAQGNYQTAQTLAKQAADLQYKDQQDKLDNMVKFVQMNRDNVSAAEKSAISKIDAQQKQQQIALDQQKQAFTLSVTYAQAGILPSDNLATATKKASAWVAQNPYTGQKPTVIGSHYDEYGNKIDTYGLVGANGQIKPLDYNSTQGNINFGMSTGTKLGLPTYNTQENNPGVSRPVRNNNPGNIKATAMSINYPGVVGVESTAAADGGNFLIFADPQAGMNAVGQLLQSNVYKGMNAEQAIKKYNGGGSYGAATLGLDPNQDLQKQLQDPAVLQRVTTQLASSEGFNASTTGVKGAVGTLGSPTIDATTPGYDSAPIGKTQMTQAAIDQAALSYAMGDKSAITSRTGKGVPLLQANAIKNRAAEINQGGNITANKSQLTALTSTLTEQTKYANTVERSLNNAEEGFKQITQAFNSANINTSESTFLNSKANDISKFFGNNTDKLRAFQAGLQEVSNEYQQVFSRGGQVTDTVRNKANDIFDGNLSIKDLMAVQKELQTQGEIVKSGTQSQVKNIQDQINNIIKPGTTKTGQPPANTTMLTWTDGKQYYVPNDKLDAARQNGWK